MSTLMNKKESIGKVETIDCRITNKFVSSPVSFEGPLTWKEIVRNQPEKEEILRNWFNETGCWPKANSTPVFDVTDQIVYPGYSLDYPNIDERGESIGTSAFLKIRKAVLEKIPWIGIRIELIISSLTKMKKENSCLAKSIRQQKGSTVMFLSVAQMLTQ